MKFDLADHIGIRHRYTLYEISLKIALLLLAGQTLSLLYQYNRAN